MWATFSLILINGNLNKMIEGSRMNGEEIRVQKKKKEGEKYERG